MNNKDYTILVADDDKSLNDAIRIFLNKKGFNTLSTYNGIDTLDVIEKNTISLLLLDVMMPYKSGLEILKHLRSYSDIPVIMLTALGEEWDKEKGFTNGADDYVTKPFSLKELNFRIEAVLKRCHNQNIIKDTFVLEELSINTSTRSVTLAGEEIILTKKTFDLLYVLVLNKGVTFTRESLLNNVWDNLEINDDRTVDVHIKNLRKSLGDYGQRIKTVWGVGYKFE